MVASLSKISRVQSSTQHMKTFSEITCSYFYIFADNGLADLSSLITAFQYLRGLYSCFGLSKNIRSLLMSKSSNYISLNTIINIFAIAVFSRDIHGKSSLL